MGFHWPVWDIREAHSVVAKPVCRLRVGGKPRAATLPSPPVFVSDAGPLALGLVTSRR